jgi:hypothetical protein
MGARNRSSPDAIAYLISLLSERTRFTFTPSPSSISNLVTVGPAV